MKNPKVLYEDNHLLALAKPAGMPTHGDETGDESLLDLAKQYIKVSRNKPGDVFCAALHRLDRPVSGVVIFGTTSKGIERMNRLFKERKIKKTYHAITEQNPNPLEGDLKNWLKKDHDRNKVQVTGSPKNGWMEARTLYWLHERNGSNYLLELDLITGRPHQARAQLSYAKMPIKGDVKYGYSKKNKTGKIYLHCKKMAFVHPVRNEQIEIDCNYPNDPVWNLFKG